MPELEHLLFAVGFGTAVGCTYYLLTFVWDALCWLLSALVAHLREAS